MKPIAKVDNRNGRIEVTVQGRFDNVDGWPEAREDLGLNKAGPEAVEGIEVAEETPWYHDEDDDYPAGYRGVVLAFESPEALERTADRLYDKATERFEWGDSSGAEKVQDFAGAIPHPTEAQL